MAEENINSPSSEEFGSWWHPSDALDKFIALGNDEARNAVLAMLRDGLIPAVAERLIIAGEDQGLSPVSREIWSMMGDQGFWSSSRFRIMLHSQGKDRSISAYGVRLDPEAVLREAPPRPNPPPPLEMPSIEMERLINPPSRAGRRAAAWWPAFAEELALYVHEEGVPVGAGADGQGAMIEAILQRLSDRGVDANRTTIQPVIQAVLDRLRAAGN